MRFVLRQQRRRRRLPARHRRRLQRPVHRLGDAGAVAAGRDPSKVRRNGSRTPGAYLRSLTAASGAVRYSRTSTQTPVWVTGQALTALARKPFPLRSACPGGRGAGPGRRADGRRHPGAGADPGAADEGAMPAPRRPVATPTPGISDTELEALARQVGMAAAVVATVVL